MRSVDKNGAVKFIHHLCHFGRRAGCYFLYLLHRMFLVSRIYSFGRIAGKKVLVEPHAAYTLHDRDAFLLRHPGIDRRFVNNDVAFRDYLADCLARTCQWSQIRTIVAIDRCRNRHYINIAVLYLVQIRRTPESVSAYRFLQEFVAHLQSGIMSLHQGCNSVLVQIIADCFIFRGEQSRQRQAHISQSYNRNLVIFHLFHYLLTLFRVRQSPVSYIVKYTTPTEFLHCAKVTHFSDTNKLSSAYFTSVSLSF